MVDTFPCIFFVCVVGRLAGCAGRAEQSSAGGMLRVLRVCSLQWRSARCGLYCFRHISLLFSPSAGGEPACLSVHREHARWAAATGEVHRVPRIVSLLSLLAVAPLKAKPLKARQARQ